MANRTSVDTMDVIYAILQRLEQAIDEEHLPLEEFGPEKLGISERRWALVIEMMLENGLIKGIGISRGAHGDISVSVPGPRITLAGLQFLAENSQTAKVVRAAKLIKDLVPGL